VKFVKLTQAYNQFHLEYDLPDGTSVSATMRR
jgi:hypothetical protein